MTNPPDTLSDTRILAGIDEAGYGPLLGPLCVGLAVFRVPIGPPHSPPDLWDLLSAGVCRTPGRGGRPDPQGRIPIADSKLLKLSSSVKTTHPLIHLERGVLAMLRALHGSLPETDTALLAALHAGLPQETWYEAPPSRLPHACPPGPLAICAAQLERTLAQAGVMPMALRCRVMGEGEFNALACEENDVGEPAGKAATTGSAVRDHLRFLWEQWGHAALEPDGSCKGRLGIVCDRQGGRVAYASFLRTSLPNATITTLEETDIRSRYIAQGVGPDGQMRRAGISFLVEAEQGHLPVALASMIAKLCRELCMERFNRNWRARAQARGVPELKPTAGYALDAQRWLADMASVLSKDERAALVRVF